MIQMPVATGEDTEQTEESRADDEKKTRFGSVYNQGWSPRGR